MAPISRYTVVLASVLTLLGRADAHAQSIAPLTNLQFDIVGIRLVVTPATLTVPRNIATQVNAELVLPPGAGPEAQDALNALALGSVVAAELRGPSMPPVEIHVKPGEPIPIPALALPGDYFLDRIRLERNGIRILDGSPSLVPITVIADVLMTSVTSRPLGLDEIRQKGIVIDETNFHAINFEIAFNIDGTPFKIDVPVAVPTVDFLKFQSDRAKLVRDVQIVNQTLQRDIVTLPPQLDRPGLNFSIAALPFFPVSDEGSSLSFGPPPIAGLLVIPGNVAFLNQFFSVLLMVSNVAPDGTPLVLRDVNATIALPTGLDRVPGESHDHPGDDPIRMARLPGVGEQKTVQVVQLGPDGKLGTADDIAFLAPQQKGEGEFVVEGLLEGSHTLDIDIDAVLHGLPQGPVKLKGAATGAIFVRNPTFSITLSQPRTVRKDEPFDLYATVTNTSKTPANLVSVTLDGNSISGAHLAGDQPETITFDTLLPGDSATAKFSLVSQLTGDVTFSSGHFGSGLAGRIQLRAGIGERGIPLAPNAIVLPKTADQLPPALIAAAQRVLGQALSIATAPAEALPDGVLYVRRQTVISRGRALAEAGQRVQFGELLARAIDDLLLDWLGDGDPDAGFDQLLRTTDAGAAFMAQAGGIVRQAVASTSALDFQQAFADAVSGRTPHLSAISGSGSGTAPVLLTVTDGSGHTSGIEDESIARRINSAAVLELGDAGGRSDFVVATHLDSNRYVIQARATATGSFDLGVVVPTGVAGQLAQLRYAGIAIEAGGIAQAIADIGAAPSSIVLRVDRTGDGVLDDTIAPTVVSMVEGPPQVLTVRQLETSYFDRPGDLRDPATHGLLVAVLFNKRVTEESAELPANYAIEANEIAGARIQQSGRLVYLYLRKPIGNLVARSLTIDNIVDARGAAVARATYPVQMVLSDGARVFGQVRTANGQPVPDALLSLSVVFGQGGFHVATIHTDREGGFDFEYVTRLGDRIILTAQHPVTLKFAQLVARIRGAGEMLLLNPTFLGRGTVRGVVYGSSGAPVAGTRVLLMPSATSGVSLPADTNEHGEYVAAEVPVGPYTVRSHDETGAYGIASGVLASALDSATTDVVLVNPPSEAARVVGRVFLAGGVTPASGFRVYAGLLNRQQAVIHASDQTTTDANGSFAFEQLAPDTYDIVAVDPATQQIAFVRVAVAASTTTSTSIVMESTGRVEGWVYDAQGEAVEGALVAGGISLGITDATGHFEIEGVPPGKRLIEAGNPRNKRRGSTEITVVPGQTATVFITLEARATIVGYVYTADGSPVGGATVRIPQSDGFIFVFANNSGMFTFPDLPLGDYLIQAPGPSKEGLIEWMTQKGMDPRSAFTSGDIPADLGGDPPATAGDRNAALRAYQSAAQAAFNVTDNALAGLPPVPAGGFGWNRVKLFEDSVTRTANVTYLRQGSVSGTTVDASGAPTAALVRVLSMQPGQTGGPSVLELRRTKTDAATGAFSFTGIARFDTATFQATGIRAGDFTLEATNPFTRLIPTFRGQLNPNEPDLSNIALQFPSGVAEGTISGTVLMPDGTSPAPAGTAVAISFGTLQVSTDANGHFESRFPIPAGQYRLTVETPGGGLRGDGYANVIAGRNANVTIRLLGLGSVVATLRRANGAPVGNADVRLRRFTFPNDVAEGTTAPDGTVRFVNITEGAFEVVATEAVTGLQGRASNTIARGATLQVPVTLTPSGRVTGTFVAADGHTPIANAQVVLTSRSGTQGYAATNAAGRFVLEAIPVGMFSIDGSDPFTGRIGRAAGELLAEGDVRDVTLVQVANGTVEGFALRADGVTPLQAVTVTLRTSGVLSLNIQATTRSDGSFRFEGVPQGTFELETRANGFTGTVTGHLDFEGETVAQNVLLAPFGTLRVKVVRAGNQLVDNATVSITGPTEGGAQRGLSGSVDANGEAVFEFLPLGTYVVIARSLADEHDGGKATASITEPNQTAESTVTLRGVGRVDVTVVTSSGNISVPSAHVVLTARAATGNEQPRPFGGTFLSSGVASIPGVPIGDFYVRAEAGALAGLSTGTIPAAGATVPITVVLGSSGSIAGRVLLPDGVTPALGAFVTLNVTSQSSLQSGVLQVTTDITGTFEFGGVPLGPFTVSILEVASNGTRRVTDTLASDGQRSNLGDLVLDNTAPRVTGIDPVDGGAGVSTASPIAITFNEAMNASSFRAGITDTTANIQVLDGSTRIAGSLDVSTDARTVTFTPLSPLRSGARYTVLVKGVPDGPRNDASLVLLDPFVSAFTVRDMIPPVLGVLSPAAGARQVLPESTIRIPFSEPIAPTFTLALTTSSGEAVAGDVTLAIGNTTVIFTPSRFLQANERYTITMTNVADAAGNPLAGNGAFTSHFFTVDTIRPGITSFDLPPARAGTTISVAPHFNATDVARVEYSIAGQPMQIVTTPGFALSLRIPADVSSLTVIAVACDQVDNCSSPPTVLPVSVIPNLPPTATLTSITSAGSPARGQALTFEIKAADDVALAQIVFSASGAISQSSTIPVPASAGTSFTTQRSVTVPANAASNDTFTVQAAAIDTAGIRGAPATLTFTIRDAVPPTITVASPVNNAQVMPGTPVDVIATVADDVGAKSITLTCQPHIDGCGVRNIANAPTTSTQTFTLQPVAAAASGPVKLTLSALDTANNSAAPVVRTVQIVDSVAPIVTSLQLATGGTQVRAGHSAVVRAAATDNVAVTELSFRVGLQAAVPVPVTPLPGTQADYTISIPATAADGSTIEIGARARDAAGNVSNERTLTLQVAASTPTNRAPQANAGSDQTPAVGSVVQLDGGASTDPDGDAVSYHWTFASRPAGSAATLSDANAATPSFTVDRPGAYVVELVVSDAQFSSAPDVVVVTTRNSAPLANAGPDQTATLGQTVTLTGAGSTDTDGDALTFNWTVVSKPATSSAALSGVDTVNPTFVVDVAGAYVFELTVNDGKANGAPDRVRISTFNSSPVANAGADQTVFVTNTVHLDASASTDVDGNDLQFAWSFVSRPGGSVAALTGATTLTPTFVVDRPGRYELQVIVDDGISPPSADTVVVTTENSRPVANAGADRTIDLGTLTQLDGSSSTDVDGTSLTFSWSIVSAPSGSAAAISDPSAVQPTFTADRRGTYVLQLIVNDGALNSAADTVVLTTRNSAPLANAGPDQTVPTGTLVALTGAASTDPDNDLLSYQWSLVSRPPQSTASLFAPTTSSPSFTPDVPGNYVVQLIVSDGVVNSAPDTVTITTGNVAPVANAGPDQVVPLRATVRLDGGGSNDANSDPLSYAWALLAVPSGSTATLSSATSLAPTFVADRFGTYVAQLIVSDGTLNSAPDTVTITIAPGQLTIALVGTNLVGVGRTETVNVTIVPAAQAGGVQVTVTSDDTGVARIGPPAVISIPENGTSGQVSVTGISSGNVTLRAAAPGYTDASLNIGGTPNLITMPAQLIVAPGQSTLLPITIAPSPAPAGGVQIAVVSSDPSRVTVVTPTVTIPQGAFSANATIRGTGVGTAVVDATNANYASAHTQVTTSANLNIVQTTATFNAGLPTSITVQLESGGAPLAAPAPGVTLTLTPTDPGCVAVTSPLTIATGLVNTTATLNYGGTTMLPCTTTVTARATDLSSDTMTVTVNPTAAITLFSLPATIGAGLQDGAYAVQLGASNHGGVTLHLQSSNPAVMRLSPNATTAGTESIDIPIANGSLSATYYIQGVEGAPAPTTATITATAPGFTTRTGSVAVVQPALALTGLLTSTTSLSPDDVFAVTIGVPISSTVSAQAVRAGASTLQATVTNDAPAVGRLVTASQTAQSVTVALAPGQSSTATTVAAGGIAFDALGDGTAHVAATIPGFATTPSATVTVVVSTPTITLFSMPATVGAGLQDGAYSVQLGASNHGGLTLRLQSSNPAVMRLSPNATTAGTEFIDIPIANGSVSATYYIQGVEGAPVPGAVTLTATAAGFATSTATINVVRPAVALSGLLASTTSLSADDPFSVVVGVPISNTVAAQAVRVGGQALQATITNELATVGRLVTSTQAGQTATVAIAPGQSSSPLTVAAGGVAFDAMGGGTSHVVASIPGFLTTAAGDVAVTVSTPTITLFSLPTSVGAGLQDGGYSLQLGASNHGGVTLRLQSSNPGAMRVAPNATTPGTEFIDIPIANGNVSATYYIQGVEGAAVPSAVSLIASAPGFATTTATVNIVQPAVALSGLLAITTSLSDDDAFAVVVGVPISTTVGAQAVRAGGVALQATLTNGAATVGQLVTSTQTAQSVTVSIMPGQSSSPSTVAAGGVAFDALGSGTSHVIASIPGFITTSAGDVAVTVSTPTMTLFGLPTTVGAGLQDGAYSLQLGASNHGGVVVHLQSSNPGVMRLAPNATTAGTESIDIPIANGAVSATYFIQGVEGAPVPATVTLTASAPGFNAQTGSVTVLQPALAVGSLAASMTQSAADDPFVATIGVPIGAAVQAQSVRAGGVAVAVTVTSGVPAVGRLVTNTITGGTVSVSIPVGQSSSPSTTAAGGVAFDPLSAGQTDISLSSPGALSGSAATWRVTVSP